MENKRVLLIESGRFIGGVIHSLFEANEQLTVIEAQPKDGAELILMVKRYHPDVIVMDDTLKFDSLAHLLPYLSRNPRFRVVVVDTSSNQVEIYQKNLVPVRQSSDLFAVI